MLRHDVRVLFVADFIHFTLQISFSTIRELFHNTSDVKFYYMHGPIHEVFVPNSWALASHMSDISCVRELREQREQQIVF